MRAVPLHLEAGSDLHRSLSRFALEHQAEGFVLSVVGNLSQAAFQCPGQEGPSLVQGDLEIITLQGTVSPQGVHLHLSLSDATCQVWGGHLEPGTLVQKGADVLVGVLEDPAAAPSAAAPSELEPTPRLEIVVSQSCPWSRRALRLLHSLAIPHRVIETQEPGPVPQVFVDGQLIGGYDALAELHANGQLIGLRP